MYHVKGSLLPHSSELFISINADKENDKFAFLRPNKAMSTAKLINLQLPFELKAHEVQILEIQSRVLEKNPLGDPSVRQNYVLIPKGKGESWPVIFHLSGYFSTGYQSFYLKTLSDNFVQKLDQGVLDGNFPKAIHVFVEATTFWGGSQFINSAGCGKYSDYILKELVSQVISLLPASSKSKDWCVMGASSGGYGALHIVSQSEQFSLASSVAPDSYFQASLLPEIFEAAAELNKYKSFKEIKKLLKKDELQDKRSFFNLMNVIAMAHCYAPANTIKKDFIDFPVDLYTGEVDKKIWSAWEKHDPIHFLKKRNKTLKGKEIFLDVGKYDNFSLQYGTRQIAQILKQQKVKNHYTEFSGNHFGLTKRRLVFLAELKKKWKK
jgi:enterochelin esterase-like enzyme